MEQESLHFQHFKKIKFSIWFCGQSFIKINFELNYIKLQKPNLQ